MAGNVARLRAVLDDQVSGGLDKIRAKFDSFDRSKAAQSLLQGVGLGAGVSAYNLLANAAGNAKQFIEDSVTAASNLQQSVGAASQVFGPAAAKLEAFGKTAADAAGLSKREVNEMGAVIGAQLKGMGFSVDEAADKTISLEQRAADLAATFGGKTSDAIVAISALLRGERDPIERYGVSLKEADVQARIAALGLDTTTVAAKKNATAVASLDLLYEQTSSSAGQFARESDELAGTQQRFNARVENLQARVGGVLIPFLADATQGAIDLADGLDKVSDSSSSLEDRLDGLNTVTGIFRNVLSPGNLVLEDFIKDAQKANTHVDALGVSWGRSTSSLKKHAAALEGAKKATLETSDATGDLKAALDGLSGQVSTTALDVDDLKSEYRDSKLELKENIAKLKELEAIKNPTREQRRDIERTKQAINDDKREIINTTLKLASMGEVKFTDLVKRLNGIGVHISDLNLDARTLLNLLTDIGTATGGSRNGSKGPSGTIGGQAEGGWSGLNGPELAWRGERGPEFTITNEEIRRGALSGVASAPAAASSDYELVPISKAAIARMVDQELYVALRRAGTGVG